MVSATTERPRWARIFLPIWVGQALSLLGSQIAQFALVWWLTESTGSATVLAFATMFAVLPGVLLGPLAGALIDRWSRRLVIVAADAANALVAAILMGLFWAGAVAVWQVYLVMLLRSIAGTFHITAMQASTSLLVPEGQLARVAGANQALQGAMSIIAPPVAALLLGVLPLWGMLAIDVVSAGLAILPLLFISIPQPVREMGASGAAAVAADMGAGLRYMASWPGMRSILALAALLNFLIAPAFALLPLLVTNHFGGGALDLSALNTAWALGIMLGGIGLGVWGGFRKRMLTALSALVAMGAALLVPGLAPAGMLWAAVAALLLAGAMNSLCNGPLFAMLQAVVAPEMQGRVFSLIGSASAAMMPLGLAVAGPLADRFGVQLWFLLGGAACVLMGSLALLSPTLMRLEENHSATGGA